MADLSKGGYPRQINRAMETIGELTREKNIEVVVVFQTTEYLESQMNASAMTARNEGLRFLHMHFDYLAAEANSNDRLTVGKIDLHPSPAAHQLVAEKLLTEVWGQ